MIYFWLIFLIEVIYSSEWKKLSLRELLDANKCFYLLEWGTNQTQQDCFLSVYWDFKAKTEDFECDRECPLECSSVKFTIEKSFATFPSRDFAIDLIDHNDLQSLFGSWWSHVWNAQRILSQSRDCLQRGHRVLEHNRAASHDHHRFDRKRGRNYGLVHRD